MGEAFDVSPNTGLSSYSLGMPVPPGPGGLTPSVKLSYSSGAPNGPLGVGWSMGAGRLCRTTDAGMPVYGGRGDGGPDGDGDRFMLQGAVGAGELVDVPDWDGGWMGFREEGAFVRARPDAEAGDGEGWTVQAPDGTIYRFGTTEGSREGPGAESGAASFDNTFCWTLTRKEDVWGHTVDYHYLRDGGRLYLEEIRYAEDTPSPRSIRFVYESRTDVLGDWQAGYERVFAERLSQIQSVVEGSQVAGGERVLATMALSYETHWNTSRLTGLKLTGEDGEELPAQDYAYEDFTPESAFAESIAAPTIPPDRPGYRLFDVNGDSFPDLVRATTTGWEYYRNDGGRRIETTPRPIENPPAFNGITADWTVADLDGDGLRDILFRPSEVSQIRAYRNVSPLDGDTARFEYMGEIGTSTPVPLNDPSLRLIDLNLDRRIDFLLSPGNGQLSSSLSTVTRDDDGVVRSSSTVTWAGFQGVAERVDTENVSGVDGLASIDLSSPGIQLAEMNGDGLDDLVRVFGGAGQVTSIRIHPSRGHGHFGEGYTLDGLPAGIRDADLDDIQIVDLNTDGLGDIVVLGNSRVRYWLNEGGTSVSETYEMVLPGAGSSSFRSLSDINGNGSVDVVIVDPAADSWTFVDPIGEQPVGLLLEARNGMGGVYSMDYRSLAVAADEAADEGFAWSTYIPTPMSVVTESRISDSRGYEGVSRRRYRDPAWSVDEGAFRGFEGATVELVGDERAPSRFTDYVFYTGVGKETRDFGPVFGQAQGYFPQENLKILSGRPKSVVQRTDDGRLYNQRLSAFKVLDFSGGRRMLVATDTISIAPELAQMAPAMGQWQDPWTGWTGSPREPEDGETDRWRTRQSTEHNDYGQAIRTTNWGYVDASGEDIPGDETVSETDFINQRDPWRIGVPSEQRVLAVDGTVLSKSRTYYDGPDFEGLPLGQLTRGATTRQTQWLAGEDRWIDVMRNAYDDDGNVTTVKDALDHVVELSYDDVIRALPVREVMRLDTGTYSGRRTDGAPNALETSASYDTDRGLATSVTDFNGQQTRVTYDGLGRMASMIAPGDSAELPTVRYEYSFGSPFSSLDVFQREVSGEAGTIDTRSYVDGLGREVATLTESSGGMYTVTGQTSYTATGDPYRAYHAYETGEFALPTSVPSGVPSVESFYDEAGRVRRTTLEDGSFTRIQFRPGRTISFDPNDVDPTSPHQNTPTITEVDGLGRAVLQSLTLEDGVTRDYRSSYDARGLMLAKTLPDGTSRSWTYDSLGRRTSVTDPNAGTQRRVFDDLGHVLSQENANGEQVVSRHDPLGRLWEVALKGGFESPEDVIARYRYDVSSDASFPSNHALGRLTSREESAFDTHLDYDARGRLARVFRVLDGLVYVSGTRYDAADRPTDMIYADGSSLSHEYDTQGRIAGLGEIISDVAYNADGTVAELGYDNGVRRTHQYDERLRMRRYGLTSPVEGTILDLELDYDRAGAPTQVTDHVTTAGPLSQSRSWSYDAFYRPKQMQAASVGTIDYAYNAANSLIERTLSSEPVPGATRIDELSVGAYTLGGDAPDGLTAGPHHVTRANNRHLGYDPSGQLVLDRRTPTDDSSGGDRHLYWDPAGRLTRVELSDGRQVAHEYNGAFDRMERTLYDPDASIGERTVYLSPVEELRWSGPDFHYRKTAMLAGERVADVRSTTNPGQPLSDYAALAQAPWAAASWTPPNLTAPNLTPSPEFLDPPQSLSHGPLWALSVALALLWLALAIGLRLRRLSAAQTRRAAARTRLDSVQTRQRLSSLHSVTDTALRALSSVSWEIFGAIPVSESRRWAGAFPCKGKVRMGEGCAHPLSPLLTRTLALLLAGAMTVVGLPGCGGGGSPNVRDDEAWQPATSFVGPNDEVVFYHAPMLGTPVVQTDETGAVYNRQASTPYGVRTGQDGSGGDEFKFTDKEWDDDLGLVYFGARYYDPELSTWISVDPLVLWGDDGSLSAFDQNPLAYVGGRVTFAVDEFGYLGQIGLGAVVGGFAGLAIEGARQVISGQYSSRRLLGATVGGAVAGGLAASGIGLIAAQATRTTQIAVSAGVGGGSNIVGGLTARTISGDPSSFGSVAIDGTIGAALGGLASAMHQIARNAFARATSSWAGSGSTSDAAFSVSADAAEEFARRASSNPTAANLGQLESAAGSMVSHGNFTTPRNGALFYSGTTDGRPAFEVAESFARSNGLQTLEMTPGGEALDSLKLWDINGDLAEDIFRSVSEKFARSAQGDVRVLLGRDVRAGSIYRQVEEPALRGSPDVQSIIEIPLE